MADSGATRNFSAGWDRTAKIVSLVTTVFLIVPPLLARSVILAAISAPVIVLAYAFSPRGYEVTPEAITIKRIIGNVRIPTADIRAVHVANASDLSGATRMFGSGGLFGYYGTYRTLGLGKCSWYVTARDKTVVLTTTSHTVVLSPDDVDGFVAAFPEHHTGDFPAPELEGTGWGGLWILVIGIFIGPAVVIGLSFYSPGPPSVTLTQDTVAIHDTWGGTTLAPSEVDILRVRVVDLDTEPGWIPKSKTRGFRNSHYSSGLFKTANGTPVRVYAQRVGRMVLIPPKGQGTAVLVQVQQPDGFVNELHRTWAPDESR